MSFDEEKSDVDIMRENFCSIQWLNRNTEMKQNETRQDTQNKNKIDSKYVRLLNVEIFLLKNIEQYFAVSSMKIYQEITE